MKAHQLHLHGQRLTNFTPLIWKARGVAAVQTRINGRQKCGFAKGWFWRTYPRSGFRSGGTCERTLVPVFGLGEHPNVPSFRCSFRGNIHQKHPFGNHPFRFLRKEGKSAILSQIPPSYGFGRYGFGFSGPGLPSARQVLCGDAPPL